MKIKTLSVRQPHASLLLGQKAIETRKWSTKYRGPLLIHAGLTVDQYAQSGLELPRGGIIGRVDLVDCRPMVKEDEEFAYTSFIPGLFAWIVTNKQCFEKIIPMKGMLGLFEVDLP